jgi:hypothetical protein
MHGGFSFFSFNWTIFIFGSSKKNSVFMDSTTFDILDPSLSIPFKSIKIFQRAIIFPSNINIDIKYIYQLLNVIRVKLHFRLLFS